MFNQLSIEPTYRYDEDGAEVLKTSAEVLTAFSGESVAVYIDGKKVYDHDDLSKMRLMGIIADHTNGNLKSYGSREALYNRQSGQNLHIGSFPEDPSNIIFSDEVEVIIVQDAEDLRENLQQSQKEYVIVRILAGIVDEKMVRKYASDEIEQKILKVQDRA